MFIDDDQLLVMMEASIERMKMVVVISFNAFHSRIMPYRYHVHLISIVSPLPVKARNSPESLCYLSDVVQTEQFLRCFQDTLLLPSDS